MTGWYLLLTVLLLLANAFFVGMEFALIAARRTKIEQLSRGGNLRARLALKSIRELSFMLAGAQLGITLASLGLGAIAEPAIASLIERAVESVITLSPAVLHSISFAIALTIVVFFHMVVGEMAPKNMAIAVPEKSSLWMAIPARLYVNAFRPAIHLLNAAANAVLRLLRVQPQDELVSVHSLGEIGVMVDESAKEGLIKEFEQRLLSGAVDFGTLDAAAAMVPRTEMVAVPGGTSPAEIEGMVLETGHSRLPVYDHTLDNVIGFVHAKDLLRVAPEERELPLAPRFIRPLLVTPESRKLSSLLIDMQRERRQLALVVDEHGGTAGMISLEDLVEELVGEIQDEYDISELGLERIGEDRYLAPGVLRIDEARERLGVDLPRSGNYETVAGFLMERLGRIPKRRDVVEHDGWHLKVRQMQGRRVLQVLIESATRRPPDTTQGRG